MPQAGHQAVLVPLTTGLAFTGLFSARTDGTQDGPSRFRELGCVPEFYGRAVAGTADELWGDRGHLVRWNVGQAGRGLASCPHVRADSLTAAAGHGRKKSSQESISRTRLPDVCEGCAAAATYWSTPRTVG